ncbi:hypothetical protein C9374_004973 [Naegleria lovaniensis]|uniref:Protein kinase domain-containing protein n=1 Tax=Naegleria lovaniensis TaxID=51637 RepID=A0AA88GPP9_NAELO|nr:uncharacterized protein C9374_004973 [Naegleria lovaniensis]KAG2383006.1 hypothetical protein C9374_004973 [Naegleria lovaniensis]
MSSLKNYKSNIADTSTHPFNQPITESSNVETLPSSNTANTTLSVATTTTQPYSPPSNQNNHHTTAKIPSDKPIGFVKYSKQQVISSPALSSSSHTSTNTTTPNLTPLSSPSNTSLSQPSSSALRDITSSDTTTPSTSSFSESSNNNNNSNEKHFTPLYPSQNALKTLTLGLSVFYKSCARENIQILTVPSEGVHNGGHDNIEGNLILFTGAILGDRYHVLGLLGQGTFGQVVKCEDLFTKQTVAVKVIKNKTAYVRQAQIEISVLDDLKNHGKEQHHHIITKLDQFTHMNHLCIVVELLGMNLFELIKQNRFIGLSLNLISVFLSQMLDALCLLADADIIHCDLKPENILLTDLSHPKDLLRVIDFGSACYARNSEFAGNFYIQSRFYRAPEVLLGLRYNKSIDMWSLGCICAELFLGLPLLPGVNEYNQLARIVEMFGTPPPYMIEYGKFGSKYFNQISTRTNGQDIDMPLQQDGSISFYELKPERQFYQENPKVPQLEWKRYFNYTKLPDLVNHYVSNSKVDEKEMTLRASFADFLNGLLQLDPFKRWTPDQAILHPFITNKEFTTPFIPPQTKHSLANAQQLKRLLPRPSFPTSLPPHLFGTSIGTPNQSFLSYGLSPVTGPVNYNSANASPMTNSYLRQAFAPNSLDPQQIPLGTSPYVPHSIPISNTNQVSGSYSGSFGSYTQASSWGSNINCPNVNMHGNYMAPYSYQPYQASPSTGSYLGMSPQVFGSSILGSTPSAAGSYGNSYGRRRSSAARNPPLLDGNIRESMQGLSLEDNNTNATTTHSGRSRSFSNGGTKLQTNNSQKVSTNKSNANVGGIKGQQSQQGSNTVFSSKPPKHPQKSPTGRHRRNAHSSHNSSSDNIDVGEGSESWDPFFNNDDTASSTGSFNPYFNSFDEGTDKSPLDSRHQDYAESPLNSSLHASPQKQHSKPLSVVGTSSKVHNSYDDNNPTTSFGYSSKNRPTTTSHSTVASNNSHHNKQNKNLKKKPTNNY